MLPSARASTSSSAATSTSTIAIPHGHRSCAILVWVVSGKDAASAMSSRRPASTSTPPNTAAWRSGATPSSRLPSRAALQALGALAAVPDRLRAVAVHALLRPRRWASTASAAAFLGGLNPIGAIFASFFIQHITAGGAYVDKIPLLLADLRSDLGDHHLSVRLRAVPEDGA